MKKNKPYGAAAALLAGALLGGLMTAPGAHACLLYTSPSPRDTR